MARKPKVVVPLTTDELKTHAWEAKRTRLGRFVDTPLPPLPAARGMCVGGEVEIGALENAVVEEIRDPYVLVSYDNKPSRDNPVPLYDRHYNVWYWWDLLPKNQYRDEGYKFSEERRTWTTWSNSGLDQLIDMGCRGEFEDNPDYQRGYVWSWLDKYNFIKSVFDGLDLGKFVLVRYDYPRNQTEILDGKQRISTVVDFVLGRFKWNDRYWWEISWADRHQFTSRMVQYIRLDGSRTTRAERLRLFLEVNAAGVPQTEVHLTKVRQLYQEALKEEQNVASAKGKGPQASGKASTPSGS